MTGREGGNNAGRTRSDTTFFRSIHPEPVSQAHFEAVRTRESSTRRRTAIHILLESPPFQSNLHIKLVLHSRVSNEFQSKNPKPESWHTRTDN